MRIALSIGLLFMICSGVLVGGDWSIGVTASPSITVPQTAFTLPSPRNRFNYSFGVVGICDLSQSLFGQGALQYTRKGVLLAKNVPDTRSSIDPATGRIDMSRVVFGDASEVYESIAMPLTLNYRIALGKAIDLIVSGGFEIGLLFQRKAVLEPTTTGTSIHTETEHGFILSLTMGSGVRYSLSDKVTVLLIPAYSYSIYPDRNFGALSFHTFAFECAVLFKL